MVWVRLTVYFYKRNETFYFSRSIPADLRYRFKKRKIEVSPRTKSETIAAKSAAALSDRLERYWDSLRLEQYTHESLVLKRLKILTQLKQATTSCPALSNFIIDSRVLVNLNYSLKYHRAASAISKRI